MRKHVVVLNKKLQLQWKTGFRTCFRYKSWATFFDFIHDSFTIWLTKKKLILYCKLATSTIEILFKKRIKYPFHISMNTYLNDPFDFNPLCIPLVFYQWNKLIPKIQQTYWSYIINYYVLWKWYKIAEGYLCVYEWINKKKIFHVLYANFYNFFCKNVIYRKNQLISNPNV